MKVKIPKHVKEIQIHISAKKGLVIKHIAEKPVKIFFKPVLIESKKKTSPTNVKYFNIAGTAHHIKTSAKIQKLSKMEDLCKITIKHEWNNKHDPYACAIYCNKIKLGYIPRHLNKDFIAKAKNKIRYSFFVCNLTSYDFTESASVGPLVIAVRQR